MNRVLRGAIFGLVIGGLYGIGCLGPFLLWSSPVPVVQALALGSGIQAALFSMLFAYAENSCVKQKETALDLSLDRYDSKKVSKRLSNGFVQLERSNTNEFK